MRRYAAAGGVATAVYIGAVWLLTQPLAVDPVTSAVLATAVVIVTSYFVNRAFVFDTNRTHASAFTRFVAASGVSIVLNAGLMHLATAVWGWPALYGAVLATAIVPVVNFIVNQWWTFRPTDSAR